MTCRVLALGRMRSDGSKCQVFSQFLRSVVNYASALELPSPPPTQSYSFSCIAATLLNCLVGHGLTDAY